MKRILVLLALFLVATQVAAQQPTAGSPSKPGPPPAGRSAGGPNPLLEEWKTPFGVPPFDRIRPEHFKPAFEAAIAAQRKEIDAIVSNPAKPTFANTVEALEDSGKLLGKVNGVFFNLVAADTISMVSTSLLDMDWHTLTEAKAVDAAAFEKASFARMGLPRAIASGHRTPQFYHVFNGGYAAGYYSYLWCEVLDTDAFEAFKEKGIFDQATAASFRTNILERAGTGDLMEAWVRFRGREPVVEPLLKRRGLLPETGATAQGVAQR